MSPPFDRVKLEVSLGGDAQHAVGNVDLPLDRMVQEIKIWEASPHK